MHFAGYFVVGRQVCIGGVGLHLLPQGGLLHQLYAPEPQLGIDILAGCVPQVGVLVYRGLGVQCAAVEIYLAACGGAVDNFFSISHMGMIKLVKLHPSPSTMRDRHQTWLFSNSVCRF